MISRPRSLLAFAAVAALSAAPLSQTALAQATWPSEAATGFDNTGKGAVMCLWVIYMAMQDAARECYPGQDPALEAELAVTITAIERFMIANATPRPTQAQIDVVKASYAAQTRATPGLCQSRAGQMYQALHASGVEALKKATTDLLSTPREPVFDPCVG